MHFPSSILPLFTLLIVPAVLVSTQQINLGSFILQRSPFTGDIQIGVGQNGQILGFGGDRHFGLNLGPGRLGARSDNGLLLGGHRFGLDSLLGYQEGRGFDFGNFLNLFQPVHQLLNGGGIRPPPPPSPTWPNPQSAQVPVQNPIEPIQMPSPTLIPPPASNWAGNGQQQTNIGQEQFPPSFGEGWKSEEEMNSFERTKGGLEEGQRELMPWSEIKSANGEKGGNWRGQGRITTEGRFRNGGEIGKNDGETKKMEEFVKGKTSNGLPVPNGLEPLKI